LFYLLEQFNKIEFLHFSEVYLFHALSAYRC